MTVRISVPKEEPALYQPELESFIRSLKRYQLTKQQIKTLRGQALAGDLAGAQKGLERMATRHENNRTF